MAADPMRLRQYTRSQLIEELARRANAQDTRRPKRWCHDCAHYATWGDLHPKLEHECPDDYNPCMKGHAMKFCVPEEYDDEYGFYLHVCADRETITHPGIGEG